VRKRATVSPVLWPFERDKTFEKADFGQVSGAMPRQTRPTSLRHVVEVRERQFWHAGFIALLTTVTKRHVFARDMASDRRRDVVSDFVTRGEKAMTNQDLLSAKR